MRGRRGLPIPWGGVGGWGPFDWSFVLVPELKAFKLSRLSDLSTVDKLLKMIVLPSECIFQYLTFNRRLLLLQDETREGI